MAIPYILIFIYKWYYRIVQWRMRFMLKLLSVTYSDIYHILVSDTSFLNNHNHLKMLLTQNNSLRSTYKTYPHRTYHKDKVYETNHFNSFFFSSHIVKLRIDLYQTRHYMTWISNSNIKLLKKLFVTFYIPQKPLTIFSWWNQMYMSWLNLFCLN